MRSNSTTSRAQACAACVIRDHLAHPCISLRDSDLGALLGFAKDDGMDSDRDVMEWSQEEEHLD